LVEIDQNMRLDLDDLVTKIEHTHARYLLISHMRGHLCDMARVTEICTRAGVVLIEDCAHTMGAYWRETRSGNFGLAGCFSTQTYKHMNSGEGGFLTSNDPDFMARATILSGSYMLYPRHGAGPDATHFEGPKYLMPNTSARMDHLRAAILRPQLQNLDENIRRWNARYRAVAQELARHSAIALPKRPVEEKMVGSSIQFRVPSASEKECQAFIATALARGVEVKWFGRPTPDGFTSNHHSWRYAPAQKMPQSDAILATLFDIRLPLTFSEEECGLIGQILYLAANETLGQPRDRPDAPKDMAS
jgi:dTDP-4-amino-4,6-dideoxygalactose transaminase